MRRISFLPGLLVILSLIISPVQAEPAAFDPTVQTPALALDEARVLHLANLERAKVGLPPLRANSQLTQAARWYSWDSATNRPSGFCGHDDTLGRWPDVRIKAYGYPGYFNAENAYCGYVTPEQAITGWMNSSGHKANILSAEAREAGVGYYRNPSTGRGYVTFDFGSDPAYPPLVIENEDPDTANPRAALYLAGASGMGDLLAAGAPTQMEVRTDTCWQGTWQPFNARPSIDLPGGSGWRTVYARTRDALGRTFTSTDTLYLGGAAPSAELSLGQMSGVQPSVALYGLDGAGLPSMQFSLGWIADDKYPNFALNWGLGERITDSAAWGGTAFRLRPGSGESMAWVWTTTFHKDIPLVAYVRLKTSSNTSTAEVARFAVWGSNKEYGPVSIKGTDFSAANVYQEFALPFTFSSSGDGFLEFMFTRSGSAEISVDAVTVFTTAQAVQPSVTWTPPGATYRGQGVWVRYTNGSAFSPMKDAATSPPLLGASPLSLTFFAIPGQAAPPAQAIAVSSCPALAWQASESAAWLNAQSTSSGVTASVNHAGLGVGVYNTTLTLSSPGASPLSIPIKLVVTNQVNKIFSPIIVK